VHVELVEHVREVISLCRAAADRPPGRHDPLTMRPTVGRVGESVPGRADARVRVKDRSRDPGELACERPGGRWGLVGAGQDEPPCGRQRWVLVQRRSNLEESFRRGMVGRSPELERIWIASQCPAVTASPRRRGDEIALNLGSRKRGRKRHTPPPASTTSTSSSSLRPAATSVTVRSRTVPSERRNDGVPPVA
jgi:hypothetical protein